MPRKKDLGPMENLAFFFRRYGEYLRRMRKEVPENTGLVYYWAHKFKRFAKMEDLVAEGNMGLVIAAGHFEPRRGNKFATYATFWIRARMLQFTANNRIVRYATTRSARKAFFRMPKIATEIRHDTGLEATTEELAKRLNVSERDVQMTIASRLPALEVGKTHLVDPNETPEESYGRLEHAAWRERALKKALKQLDPRDAEVMRWRLKGKTLEEIAQKFSLSRERIRQLETRALVQLKAAVAALA